MTKSTEAASHPELLIYHCSIKKDILTMQQPPQHLDREASQSPSQKHLVLLDTDIGDDIDDAFALALALRSPELDLRGVTTVHGDAHTRALIVCRLLHAIGRDDIPVAAGTPPREPPEFRGQFQYGLRPCFRK